MKFGNIRSAVSSKLCTGKANEKRKAVIDLTDDDDNDIPTVRPMSSVSAFQQPTGKAKEKRKVVINLTDDEDNDIPTARPMSGVSSFQQPLHRSSVYSIVSQDERLAHELQAQSDKEDAVPNVPTSFSKVEQTALFGDARLARELQEELNYGGSFIDPSYSFAGANGAHLEEDHRVAREMQDQLNRGTASVPQAMSSVELPRAFQNAMGGLSATPEATAEMIRSYGLDVAHIPCAGCDKNHFKAATDIVLLFKQWLGESEKSPGTVPRSSKPLSTTVVASAIRCSISSNAVATCMGCGKRGTDDYTGDERILEDGGVITWHCDRGRLFLLWALLCGYDQRQTVSSRRDSYFTKLKIRPSGSSSGTGYGGSTTYGSSSMYGSPAISAGKYGTYLPPGSAHIPAQSVKTADSTDIVAEKVMTWLNMLLPSLTGKNPSVFDLNPPPVLSALVSRSAMLGKLAELLRNDSLEDATKRLNLYRTALALVNTLGSHHSMACAAIHQERQLCEDADRDLLKLSYLTQTPGKGNYDKTQSLASCLKNLDFQSKLMLGNAKAHPIDFQGVDSQQMLWLCQRVCEVADVLLANSSANGDTTSSAPKTAGKDSWQAALAVLDLQDQEIINKHSYAAESRCMQNPPIGRMKTLSLQVASLRTSLPPGIFVRYCTSRLDVMKVLIIGPKSTPYENGLFEFDLLCPANFPIGPPKMNFRTTGGGSVRFNPNLYNNGKVCLSLLGTWSGETWQPGKSTLLQVLISIQAMIFCDEPWCNEPGREKQLGSNASIEYNREIQGYTVQHAMLGWLQGRDVDPVWGDVVMQHFSVNATDVTTTVNRWTAAGARCKAHAPKLLAALQAMRI